MSNFVEIVEDKYVRKDKVEYIFLNRIKSSISIKCEGIDAFDILFDDDRDMNEYFQALMDEIDG